MAGGKWFQNDYRRNLVDMHIEDWDERFLSKLDARTYVSLLKRAQVKGAMVYANSHVGYCYWPTKTGHMHRGLKGRDFLGEFIRLCREEGMDVIIYFTLVYDNWAYEHDPSWRIVDVEGKGSRERSERILDTDSHGVKRSELFNARARYGVCCPNSQGYREYVAAQLRDLGENYDFDGMFLDMTFWPTVCYCPNCCARYAEEVGGEMPTVIDWSNPVWTAFQRKREQWLGEFADFATAAVRKAKPRATVDHQFSTSLATWLRGSTEAIARASDYCGGDFYGGYLEQTFICKLLYNLTATRPFEFHTSRCYPNLRDHTTMKSKEMLRLHAAVTQAHSGAFLFIDAIDPEGTLNPRVYDTLGEVFSETEAHEPFLGGELRQDVGIYFSFTSKFDPADNGKRLQQARFGQPHRDAAVGAARKLKAAHIPFGVLSKSKLHGALQRHKVIVLPEVFALDEEEKRGLVDYVRDGGKLYASGAEVVQLLPELIRATFQGRTEEVLTYVAPTPGGTALFPGITADYPLTLYRPQPVVEASSKDEVMATVTLPYTSPNDGQHFVSIHSDPPGVATQHAAAIRRKVGRGEVLWVSGPIEAAAQPPHATCFVAMMRELAGEPFGFGSDGPPAVEVTVLDQPENKRTIVNLVNMQEELPAVPVREFTLDVAVRGPVKSVKQLPGGEQVPYEATGSSVRITVPSVDVFAMIAVDLA